MTSRVTQERLKELLHYDPETGVFTWLVPRKGTGGVGSVAGRSNPSNKYWEICIDYKRYLAHRLACLYMTGKWPSEDVDHIDRNRTNNAFRNLREATRSQNLWNTVARGTQASGKRWQAVIFTDGVRKCLGTYDTEQEAHEAYTAAAKLRGEFSPYYRQETASANHR